MSVFLRLKFVYFNIKKCNGSSLCEIFLTQIWKNTTLKLTQQKSTRIFWKFKFTFLIQKFNSLDWIQYF